MAFFSRFLLSTPIPLKNRITSIRSIPSAFHSVLFKPKSFLPKQHISSSISNKQQFRTKASTAQVGKSKVQVFDSEEGLAVALAEYVGQLSDHFSKERGTFTVALSGGSLIKSLRKLVEAPYIDSVDWTKWHVLWVDERVVPRL